MIGKVSIVLLSCVLFSRIDGATIIVVRHADRNAGMSAGMSSDVPLNSLGEERARQLANVLKDANIRAIYTTEVKRTQQTAEPTAQEFHLKPVVIPAKELDALVAQLKALPDNEVALVVGHAGFAHWRCRTTQPFDYRREYDRMILVTTGKGKPSVLTLRYGAVSKP
jgi:broad specificity phosphatase PhoE